jgi:hypothetical protein
MAWLNAQVPWWWAVISPAGFVVGFAAAFGIGKFLTRERPAR